jgi:DNA-binding NarL/FixJ family response regulator
VEARTAFEELGSVFFTRRATALLESIDGRLTAASGDASSPLTRRQTEILQLVSRGMNDHAIAKTLGLSEHTVHRHVANILLRLNAPNRAAAAAHATSRGLIAAHAMAKTGHARRS